MAKRKAKTAPGKKKRARKKRTEAGPVPWDSLTQEQVDAMPEIVREQLKGMGMIDEQGKIATGDEDLHPDLVPYVDEDAPLPMLRHPLMWESMSGLNRGLNTRYRARQEIAAKTLAEKDFASHLSLYGLPIRLTRFAELFGPNGSHSSEISDARYWELLAWVFTEVEFPFDNEEVFTLLRSDRPSRSSMMAKEEQAEFRKLPKKLTIYRGHGDENQRGWSWTLNREKAVWFAMRLNRDDPYLSTGTVSKVDVHAYFTRRDEAEILVCPDKVKITSEVELEDEDGDDE